MNSHFKFTREQRNGILLLIIFIIVLQGVYFFIKQSTEPVVVNKRNLKVFVNELDSLRQAKLEEQKPEIYPFNPNFITDYKGFVLGMSNEEIDRLLVYRSKNQWINSVAQFQQVTRVSDSLLQTMVPYFKFPQWVHHSKPSKTTPISSNIPKTFAQKQDLNTATAVQLQKVNGIGVVLSERIIKFRNTFEGGFIADVQLEDVYGLSPEVIEKIKQYFTVKTPRSIKKINLNKATTDQLVTIQHIDYNLAYNIVEQCKLRDGFKSFDELTKVKDFPVNKINIIKLYLSLD